MIRRVITVTSVMILLTLTTAIAGTPVRAEEGWMPIDPGEEALRYTVARSVTEAQQPAMVLIFIPAEGGPTDCTELRATGVHAADWQAGREQRARAVLIEMVQAWEDMLVEANSGHYPLCIGYAGPEGPEPGRCNITAISTDMSACDLE